MINEINSRFKNFEICRENEFLSPVWGFVPFTCDNSALAQDVENQELCWNIWKIPDLILSGVYDQIPGPVHKLHICVQHHHEDLLHRKCSCNSLSDVSEIQGRE